MRENPNIPSLDIMKEVGKIWQSINKEELQRFKVKSDADMERFKREHAKFITDINDLRAKSNKQKHILQTEKMHQSNNLRVQEQVLRPMMQFSSPEGD